MERTTITVVVTGNPLGRHGSFQVQAGIGTNAYTELGAGAFGTQFKKQPEGNPAHTPREAARIMCFPITEEITTAFPEILDWEKEDADTPVHRGAEALVAYGAEAGMRMLIEWLMQHPDPAAREQAIQVVLGQTRHGPIFEGLVQAA